MGSWWHLKTWRRRRSWRHLFLSWSYKRHWQWQEPMGSSQCGDESCFCSASHFLREKPQEWGWNCPIFHLWLPFLTPTMHAASPQKECKGDTATAIECWGRVWRRQSHKIHSPTSAADLLGWSFTSQTWDWLMELFLHVPLAGVRKSTNKQGDLTRRNIGTPSKRKKNPWIPPGINNRVSEAPGALPTKVNQG